MAVRPIVLFPSEKLTTPCEEIKYFDESLKSLIVDLIETLHHSPGVGLAAPQIGVLKKVSVIDIRLLKQKKSKAPLINHGQIILVNPVLRSGEGEQIPREGCLSIPEFLGNVRRFNKVTVDFRDELGNQKTLETEGFEALAFQHEIDHLNGKLFLDRVLNVKTDIFRRKTS